MECVTLQLLVRWPAHKFHTCKTSSSPQTSLIPFFSIIDDGKLQAESDSGEFWVLFGGFAPIGKKATSDDDVVLETTAPKLYRYCLSENSCSWLARAAEFFLRCFQIFMVTLKDNQNLCQNLPNALLTRVPVNNWQQEITELSVGWMVEMGLS